MVNAQAFRGNRAENSGHTLVLVERGDEGFFSRAIPCHIIAHTDTKVYILCPSIFHRYFDKEHAKTAWLCQIHARRIEKRQMALVWVIESRGHMVLVMMVREPCLSFESRVRVYVDFAET